MNDAIGRQRGLAENNLYDLVTEVKVEVYSFLPLQGRAIKQGEECDEPEGEDY